MAGLPGVGTGAWPDLLLQEGMSSKRPGCKALATHPYHWHVGLLINGRSGAGRLLADAEILEDVLQQFFAGAPAANFLERLRCFL